MIRTLTLLLIATAVLAPHPGTAADAPDASALDAGIRLFMGRDYDQALTTLEAAAAEDPENADVHAWLAEVHRRLNNPDASFQAATRAIQLDPCHSFAYNTMGELHFEQYGINEYSDNGKAWEYFTKAAECDPTDGNPWLGIWNLAMIRGDEKTERFAVEQMHETGFFTPAAYEFARWLLRDLPANAVLLTNGDMDTYPLLVVQEAEGFRTDVAVVNYSLLNTDFYPRLTAGRTGYPLPTEEPAPYRRGDNYLVLKSAQYVKYWIESGIASSRPLAFSVTVADLQITPDLQEHLQLAGGHFRYMPEKDHPDVDSGLVWKGLQAVDTETIRGPMASKYDRSPVRHGPGLYDNFVAVGIRAMTQDIEDGQGMRAMDLLAWAESFYAGIPEDRRGRHDYGQDMEQIRVTIEEMD